MKRVIGAFYAAGALAVSAPAWAHHSGAMFDRARTQVITGKVSEFSWTNPHASFKVAVTDAAGRPEVWAIEMNSPNNLMREGWKRTSLKPGDTVTVTVNPLRDGSPGGLYVGIRFADGHSLGSVEPAASDAAKPAQPRQP